MTELEQLEAVKKYGLSLQYIKNPSAKVQIEAVKCDGRAIQYIENPTREMKNFALKNNYLCRG